MDQGQHLTARQMGEQTANRWLLAGTLPLRALRQTVRDDLAALGAVCRRLEQAPPEQQARPAVRWLLENWYLARRAGAQAERALRARHRLRALREQGRVLRLEQAGRALAGLACFEEREIAAFLSGIQDVEPLEEEELAALPQAIVAGLLTDLRRTAEELEALTVCREHTSRDWEGEFRELFARLRRLQAAHLGPWLEELSVVDRLFRLDPAGSIRRWMPTPGGATGPRSAAWPEGRTAVRRPARSRCSTWPGRGAGSGPTSAGTSSVSRWGVRSAHSAETGISRCWPW